MFKNHLRTWAYRENHITGVLYKDDPTIFAVELLNEVRVPCACVCGVRAGGGKRGGLACCAWVRAVLGVRIVLEWKGCLESGARRPGGLTWVGGARPAVRMAGWRRNSTLDI